MKMRNAPSCLLLLVISGCGIQIAPRASGPTVAPSGPGVQATYTVRYEVSCRSCDVRFSSDAGNGLETANGLWSKTVRIRAAGGGGVLLEAEPTLEGVWVRSAKIFVNGRLASQFQVEDNPRVGESVSLTASLR